MQKHLLLIPSACALIAVTAAAQSFQRRATITGGGGDSGKCTLEVVVDGAADVEVRGDNATVRNLAGQPPQLRRFQCNSPMPPNPPNFRFSGVDGRGSQRLTQDPRNGGAAVVHIEDPQGGSEAYTFDLMWGGGQAPAYPTTQAPPPYNGRRDDRGDFGRGDFGGGDPRRQFAGRFSREEAVQGCQDAVVRQASDRFRGARVTFLRTDIDDNPGPRDRVIGTFSVRSGNNIDTFSFSCSVNLDRGTVWSADIRPLEQNRSRFGYDNRGPEASRTLERCEDAVADRLRRDGHPEVNFGAVDVQDRPGRDDLISGTVRTPAGNRTVWFDFSCNVRLETSEIRSVDVRMR